MCSWRRIATLLAICATAIGFTAGASSAAPAKVAWTKCHSDLGPFQCETMQVPLDYNQPTERRSRSHSCGSLPRIRHIGSARCF